MTAIHGKNAAVYLSPGTGAAVPVSEQQSYSIEGDFDTADTTELGDVWGGAVKGVHKWSGKLDGNFNTAGVTLWSAFLSDLPNNFYLYPERSNTSRYYYGTCWVKLDTVLAGGVTDKSKTTVSLTGDGTLAYNG
jgi:hypothetical protein